LIGEKRLSGEGTAAESRVEFSFALFKRGKLRLENLFCPGNSRTSHTLPQQNNDGQLVKWLPVSLRRSCAGHLENRR